MRVLRLHVQQKLVFPRDGTSWDKMNLKISKKMTRYPVFEHHFPVLEHPFPVLERLFPVLERLFSVFLFFWEGYFVPGRDGTEEFVPGHLLLPLSRDKGTPGQEFIFVPGQRDNGTSRPGLSRDVPRDVPSRGNPNSAQFSSIQLGSTQLNLAQLSSFFW